MDTTNLFNLSPALTMLLLGACIASGPLAWVWWRTRGGTHLQKRHALAALTLFLTFDLVLFGAFTRLTDSGLGCPDWPGCYGSVSPMGATHQIAQAEAHLPTGPVTHSKAWIEMVHRYLATGVGGLILVLAGMAWFEHRKARQPGATQTPPTQHPQGGLWLPLLTLVWVCIQGAFGALTVTMKLYPAIVTLHLMGGFVLLAMLCVQTLRLSRNGLAADWPALSPTLRWWVGCSLWLLMAQVALGGWVSTNYAVLACTEFPLCQGSWWPPMSFEEGFQIWRHLGLRADGTPIAFAGLTAIHMVHRLGAGVLATVLLGVAWALYRAPGMQSQAKWLAALLLAQVVTGLSNVLLQWPLATAVLHTAGAAGLLLVLTWTRAASREQAAGTLSVWQQFHALTKPRVIQLIVFCALIGMVLAVPGVPTVAEVWRATLASIGIYLVAGAAAAFNCLIEKGIDAKMKRTAWRPTARGQLSDRQALAFSALLCGVGSAILYIWINPLTMWLTFATFVGYAVIYTVILKPMTPQNIVIGGASGAMPPVLGWAAMTADVQPPALILFLIIFVWTPPHFWALALYRVEDYRKSGLPMLPVTHGSEFTRLQILLYTFVLLAACLLPFVYGMSGWLYLVVATALCLGFCLYAWQLWRDYSDALARKTFRFSLIHLSVLFAVLLIDHYIG